MKFAVLGGTGLIGSKIVKALTAAGHEALPHARSTGVDLLTGAGLAPALAGADAVVDATQSPTADDASADFFRVATGNLLTAAEHAGVRHAVLVSIVGVDQVPDLGYYRAKVVQEELYKTGPVPFSIVRTTQFFEYLAEIISWTGDQNAVRLPPTLLQPVAADDAARTIADIAAGTPLHTIRNVAGPDVIALDDIGRLSLAARGDNRALSTDPTAGPFAVAPDHTLTGQDGALICPTRYGDWLTT
ncbi:NAD(P)H-binding protein [Streptomyces sp. NPDC047974]|uniref:SDR family oxidoreductase n=1 Tax=Streptomyces sp. NPDC047974 TaxID=3154343 RepID=UPI0033FD56DF